MNESGDLQTRLNAALRLHREGELEAALEGYASVSAELSGGAACTVFSNMGAVAMAQGQYEAARAHFSAAGTHDPNNVSAMLNEAIVLTSKLGQHKEAMAKCVRALQLDDANPKTYHLLGNHHHPYLWWRPYP
jgi:Flp pilus assembly protein TadD